MFRRLNDNRLKEIIVCNYKAKSKNKYNWGISVYNENDNEKMIQGLTESLENVKIRKNIIERKYFLAIYKERNGNMEEAEKLYKEVVKKGNRLHIAGEAKKKLENLNNSRNMDKTDSTTDSIKETDENNQNESSQTVDIDEKGIDKIELKGQ